MMTGGTPMTKRKPPNRFNHKYDDEWIGCVGNLQGRMVFRGFSRQIWSGPVYNKCLEPIQWVPGEPAEGVAESGS